jgi:DNA polymerase
MEVFRTHGKIYEMSASKITGIPFEEFDLYKASSGQHHPMRKKIGKVAELASGYGGWLGAWKQFGADEYFNDDEIKKAILAWRAASPAIVEFWGGQQRNWRPELFGLEGCAVSAVLNPGTKFSYRAISYLMYGDALYCELPSGRFITYHRPRLGQSERGGYQLSFEGWNTNPKNGAPGWIRINTYGGRLCENVVQAVARDILAYAIVNLEKAGYPIVMHVHDEIVAEVPEGQGSISEFESIMSTLPPWASGWGIKATGGWRGKRYGK